MLAACDNGGSQTPIEDVYPWQITIQSDGKSRVFGITLNGSRLVDAREILGSDYQLGLFESKGQLLTLEAYFTEVTMGGMSGKFVLTLQTNQSELEELRNNAVNRKILESGAIRYTLNFQDQQRVALKPITSLSYIPYINLDGEIIQARFGDPTERVVIDADRQHLLYSNLGLDLLLDNNGKELLQYVVPDHFDTLRQPLLEKEE